jgi:ribose transport system substrate-binding protein
MALRRPPMANSSAGVKNSSREKHTLRVRFGRIILAAMVASLVACTSSPPPPQHKKYTIYLSNNFVGNDWRQQMLRSAQIAAQRPPLGGRVDLKIENVETTVQDQINSLNNIIRTHPDAILIDASSATALNPTIQKACSAGIVVVAFDQLTTAECAYGIDTDWTRAVAVEVEWIARELNGKGKILIDRGLAGAPVSEALVNGYENSLRKYPGIQIVGYFNGNYALGPEQAGVANLLAAHSEVDAVLDQGYGPGVMKAFQDAGRKLVPITGSAFNLSTVTCVQTPGASCFLASNPPYLSAEALKLAVAVLDGKAPSQKHIFVSSPFLTTDPMPSKAVPDAVIEKIVIGKNAFPNLAPGLSLPFSPDWLEIKPQEIAGP